MAARDNKNLKLTLNDDFNMLSTTKKIKFTDKDYKIGSIINWMDKGLKAEEPQDIVDNLNSTENWEASEEAHGASNQAKLGLSCHLGEWTKKYVGSY